MTVGRFSLAPLLASGLGVLLTALPASAAPLATASAAPTAPALAEPNADGFICHWTVLGPIRKLDGQSGPQAIDHEFLKNEGQLAPKPGDRVAIERFTGRWRSAHTPTGLLDFATVFNNPGENSVCYAVAVLRSDFTRTGLRLCVGSDDQVKIWLNGKELLKTEADRAAAADQDVVEKVTLRRGDNLLVMKVANGGGGFQGIVRFRWEQGGSVVRDYKIVLPPETTVAELPADGFMPKWLMLGPIEFAAGTPGAQILAGDHLNGEAGLRPKVGDKTKTPAGDREWKTVDAVNGLVDLQPAFGKQSDFCAAYLVCYLTLECEAAGLKLKVGSDDACKVWINGKEIHKFEGDRATAPDSDTVDNVTLAKGLNVIVFKIVNGQGACGGCLRFVKADNTPFLDAAHSLSPTGK